jgi:hypothetical protein
VTDENESFTSFKSPGWRWDNFPSSFTSRLILTQLKRKSKMGSFFYLEANAGKQMVLMMRSEKANEYKKGVEGCRRMERLTVKTVNVKRLPMMPKMEQVTAKPKATSDTSSSKSGCEPTAYGGLPHLCFKLEIFVF